MPQSDQCLNCKNFFGYKSCEAFPDGLPEQIMTGEITHDKPIKGQENNVVFEQKPKGFIRMPIDI